ncbi:hypothetical protein IVA96_15565 [Bradyrhizobium sp. 159]|uniref:hypothetical protein n=1 Tax=unclassified Bradyrhizobium TaxID=2631580 RepID=UPI001FFAF4F8|nr:MULTISPECIES: hypothetical protein [unclassified Bradyrhizobium]MCK1618036.1 hypothetical protein [Bradyrhizobium sp. 159]MCK1758732.1 hypothetical protein [Bradyrhizobium sp. 137]
MRTTVPAAVLTAAALALMPCSTAFAAEDGPECFSQYTKTNVCDYARSAQAAVAPTLPMKASANLTIVSVAAAGPRLVYVAAMSSSAAEAEATATARGITMQDWAAQVEEYTRNSVCSMEALAAFVGLGGEVQYFYKGADGRVLFSPLVGRNDCLKRR